MPPDEFTGAFLNDLDLHSEPLIYNDWKRPGNLLEE
jgi:hypothetical protein